MTTIHTRKLTTIHIRHLKIQHVRDCADLFADGLTLKVKHFVSLERWQLFTNWQGVTFQKIRTFSRNDVRTSISHDTNCFRVIPRNMGLGICGKDRYRPIVCWCQYGSDTDLSMRSTSDVKGHRNRYSELCVLQSDTEGSALPSTNSSLSIHSQCTKYRYFTSIQSLQISLINWVVAIP